MTSCQREQRRDRRCNLAFLCISSIIHAVLFLHLSHSLVFWQLSASQPAGDTKERLDQAPRTRAAGLTVPDNDDDFETVGHNAGGKVVYIVFFSPTMHLVKHYFT